MEKCHDQKGNLKIFVEDEDIKVHTHIQTCCISP